MLFSCSLSKFITVFSHILWPAIGPASSNHQPEHEGKGDVEKHSVQELLLFVLSRANRRATLLLIAPIHICGEESKGKSSDAERHLNAASVEQIAKLSVPASRVRLRPLTSRPRWNRLLSGIFLFAVASPVEWHDFILANSGFANRANLTVWPGFQPLMEAGPAKKMAAHGNHRVRRNVETNVALESSRGGIVTAVLFFILLLRLFLFFLRLFPIVPSLRWRFHFT